MKNDQGLPSLKLNTHVFVDTKLTGVEPVVLYTPTSRLVVTDDYRITIDDKEATPDHVCEFLIEFAKVMVKQNTINPNK